MDYFYSKRYLNLYLTRHVTGNDRKLRNDYLSTRLLFLTLQQGVQTDAVDCKDAISRPGQVSVSLSFRPPDAFDLNLVVFVDEVQSPVAWEECGYNLPILDQLCADALPYCAVGLAAFNPHLLQNNRSGLRGSFQWVCLVVETQHAPFVGSIGPPEALAPLLNLRPANIPLEVLT